MEQETYPERRLLAVGWVRTRAGRADAARRHPRAAQCAVISVAVASAATRMEGRDVNDQATSTRECPLCREEIRADAVRCKHCHGEFLLETPGHGGVCPFCKEEIHPEATRCMHCQADLAPAPRLRGRSAAHRPTLPLSRRSGLRRYGPGGQRRAATPVVVGPDAGDLHPSCASCPAWVDDNGWFGILVDCDDEGCIYEEY